MIFQFSKMFSALEFSTSKSILSDVENLIFDQFYNFRFVFEIFIVHLRPTSSPPFQIWIAVRSKQDSKCSVRSNFYWKNSIWTETRIHSFRKIKIFQKSSFFQTQSARSDWICSSAHARIRQLGNSPSSNRTFIIWIYLLFIPGFSFV